MHSKKFLTLAIAYFVALGLSSCSGSGSNSNYIIPKGKSTELRAPSYPIMMVDPYMSAWSMTDNLYDEQIKHWSDTEHPIIGAIRVDGEVYRFMGKAQEPWANLLAPAKNGAWDAKYTTNAPKGKKWMDLSFDDSNWEQGKGAFGTPDYPFIGTEWKSKNIWIRRTFDLPKELPQQDIYLNYSHDDVFTLTINGKKVVNTGYEWDQNVRIKIDKSILKPGEKNIIAVHCENRSNGGYVDFGLAYKETGKEYFANTAVQKKLEMSATKTQYTFACGPVDLELSFVSPLLMDDLDLLSRPVNYINYQVNSSDGKEHDVEVYIETTPEWAVHTTDQEIEANVGETNGVNYIKAGTTEQPVLEKSGDFVRIDWGYMYLASAAAPNKTMALGDYYDNKDIFSKTGEVKSDKSTFKGSMQKEMPSMATVEDLGKVGETPKSGYVMVAYDDIWSIQYFNENLKAWWTKNGTVSIDDILLASTTEYKDVLERCAKFDTRMWDDAITAGGKNYADLCVLAYRQAIAAHKLVKDKEGNTLWLSKENCSNGSIGTVDISYPSSPLFLKYNTELVRGMCNQIIYYSESGKWTKPFAAHDIGTYPRGNGQTYGGDMPVEESGNMLIMIAAMAKMDGNADYAAKHWEVLTTWTDYLVEHGLDPNNQLCTDDFAGHFAHNTNLSVKAIMAIASYGRLAEMLGKSDVAEKYTNIAKDYATKWQKMAKDGDHYKLTFDKPGTWSMKYNLVWDKLLNLNIFPQEVVDTEVAHYLKVQNKYGLPLDNRKDYGKSDWMVWTATLANNDADFHALIDPLHLWVQEAPDRQPMTDWYDTKNGKRMNFKARSVVGGYFIKMLEE